MSTRIPQAPRLAAADLALAARRVLEGLYHGRHRSPFAGSAAEFAEHRAYQPGDDLRAIDWRAYARSDHLLTRTWQEERDLPLTLVVDTSASMDWGDPGKAAWAQVAAVALGWLAIDQGDRVRLLAGAGDATEAMPACGGPASAPRLAAAAADLAWGGRSDLPRLLGQTARRCTRASLLILISDALAPPDALATAFAALAAQGHELVLIQVLSPAELSLPAAWGRSRLSDPEGGCPDLACDAAAVKTAYDAAMTGHCAAVARACAGCRGDHLLADSSADAAIVLGGWLRRRRAQVR